MRTPEVRFYMWITIITIGLMFIGMSMIIPSLELIHLNKILISALVAILASVGTYTSLAKILELVLSHSKLVKKFILGPSYIEGTWVGYVRAPTGTILYVVETIEQHFSSFVVRGSAYNEKKEIFAQWIADNGRIDPTLGIFYYLYTGDLREKNVREIGIALFTFLRKKRTSAPYAIEGYIADLSQGIRMEVREHRIDGFISIPEEAILKAHEYARKGGFID